MYSLIYKQPLRVPIIKWSGPDFESFKADLGGAFPRIEKNSGVKYLCYDLLCTPPPSCGCAVCVQLSLTNFNEKKCFTIFFIGALSRKSTKLNSTDLNTSILCLCQLRKSSNTPKIHRKKLKLFYFLIQHLILQGFKAKRRRSHKNIILKFRKHKIQFLLACAMKVSNVKNKVFFPFLMHFLWSYY